MQGEPFINYIYVQVLYIAGCFSIGPLLVSPHLSLELSLELPAESAFACVLLCPCWSVWCPTCRYGGEEAGHGVTDIVFGRVSPSARFPVTVYAADYLEHVGQVLASVLTAVFGAALFTRCSTTSRHHCNGTARAHAPNQVHAMPHTTARGKRLFKLLLLPDASLWRHRACKRYVSRSVLPTQSSTIA